MPNEVVERILACIDPIYDSLIRYSRVCKKWRDTIQQAPALWSHIHVVSVWVGKAEKSMLKHCLVRFKPFIRCVRVSDYHNDVFLDAVMRELLRDLPGLRCLDVPLLKWDKEFLESLESAPCLQEVNLYGFTNSDTRLWPSLIHDPHPPFLLSQDHLQILQERFGSLLAIKVCLNMLDVSQADFMAFLDQVKPCELRVAVFARSYRGSSFHYIGVNGLRHLISSSYADVITALQLHDVSVGHKETRLILKKLPVLKKLRLVFDSDRVCRNPYQFLQSDSLRELILDGLPAVYIKHLRLRMPSLMTFSLNRCPLLISVSISSSKLKTLRVANAPKLRGLHVDSTCLTDCTVSACHSMLNQDRISGLLEKHAKITALKLLGKVESLSFQKACCSSLTAIDMHVQCMKKFSDFSINCPTLKTFAFRGNLERENRGPERKSKSALVINAHDLNDVYINSPGLTTLLIQCNKLNVANINTECLTWDEEAPALDLRVVASASVGGLLAYSCRFSRFKVECKTISTVRLVSCSFTIPLKLRCHILFDLRLRDCRDITHLQIQATCTYIHSLTLLECGKLEKVTYDAFIHCTRESLLQEICQPQMLPSTAPSWKGIGPGRGEQKFLSHQTRLTSVLTHLELKQRLLHLKVKDCDSIWLAYRPFRERRIKAHLESWRPGH